MKKVFYLLAAILVMASCSVIKPRERIVETFFLDYRPYAEEGFFLSPDPYPGKFTSLGEISIEITPALLKKKSTSVKPSVKTGRRFGDGVYSSPGASVSRLKPETLNGKDLLDIAVSEARKLGADGIANLHIKFVPLPPSSSGKLIQNTMDNPSYWEISGLCISRR